MYCPPGPYSVFLSEFLRLLSQLVLSTDKIIVVGDFNIHVDVENDSLNIDFNAILDSVVLLKLCFGDLNWIVYLKCLEMTFAVIWCYKFN